LNSKKADKVTWNLDTQRIFERDRSSRVSQALKKPSPEDGPQDAVLSVASVQVQKSTFESFSQIIFKKAGILLPYNDKNVTFVSDRLSCLIRELNFKNFEELNEKLKSPSENLLNLFVSALTINKTDFFREMAHFDFFKKQLPEFVKSNSEVRIWSSACSQGAEPYSIAISASEILSPQDQSSLNVLATDIDLEILGQARQAQYSISELEGLDLNQKHRLFKEITPLKFQLIPEIRKFVHFSAFNLMNTEYRFKKKFDFIFCRNVLIYFDKETTEKVLDMLVSNLSIQGYLIIGHSESGVVRHPCLKGLGNSIFQKFRN
jgi:chemotaxis protein methyltransferase CheR